jgi:hypothetical protein
MWQVTHRTRKGEIKFFLYIIVVGYCGTGRPNKNVRNVMVIICSCSSVYNVQKINKELYYYYKNIENPVTQHGLPSPCPKHTLEGCHFYQVLYELACHTCIN